VGLRRLRPDRAVVRSTLARKCEFKGIAVPTYAALTDRPERVAIEVEWEQMLAQMVQPWGAEAGSLETIRFAAANRLCVQLDYTKVNGERTTPTIEPYSVRRTSAGHLLLFGVKADTGESRSYRLDGVNAATVTRQAFRPRYVVELTASGQQAGLARRVSERHIPAKSESA